MKIYTKTGDTGLTSLWGHGGMKRVPKDGVRVESYGAVDEANAAIGVARAYLAPGRLDNMLRQIQNDLFGLGADLSNISPDRTDRLSDQAVEMLEQWIDLLDQGLPALRQFILPGGAPAAAFLQQARTIVRRAERRLVALIQEEPSYALQLKYLNRLSDFLFVAAREANQVAGVSDELAQF
ncbi:cob(I)yrinic acid a,c-diamide adenosyltransferase [Sulfobacillus sp. hq2]|uniref:Corrinoid adenosyltransferase n=1 Tax=Sulfobacillus thermotolerans TaxID=338644 RepID=A0ABM6RPP9_9FIRM|nr:cob(I)yrinic acid a,c-diamide adenosyltransferase [Sulfobacillus sp. hq2]AUW93298.1 ATP:cob(I)alamin adenosyltransferase [Sulfobacillus thermotolerans]MCY0907363.1 cob(I)yrinic acid a,c-diamide adenosyltransferase [Sulfobacillus thermotolerans]POB11622.1 ATP:cob(I)alamin adenosyltransferase [Sulfobacillus sp. hq2]